MPEFETCESCGVGPAEVTMAMRVDGEEREVHLCHSCAHALSGDFEDEEFVWDELDAELDERIADAPLEMLMDACFFVDAREEAELWNADDEARELAALSAHGEQNLFASLAPVPGETKAVCSSCGATWSEIAREERVGCSKCYSTFRQTLSALLDLVQRAPRHVGKEPRAARKRQLRLEHLRARRDHQLALLRSRLAEAVQGERYEEAANLRDRIKVVSSSIF